VVEEDANLATGSAVDRIDQAFAVAAILDNLMRTVVSLGVDEEGAQLHRANADSGLSDRLRTAVGPGVEAAVRHSRLFEQEMGSVDRFKLVDEAVSGLGERPSDFQISGPKLSEET
jgi:hypothetical protein